MNREIDLHILVFTGDKILAYSRRRWDSCFAGSHDDTDQIKQGNNLLL
jgi:hypothetical protein